MISTKKGYKPQKNLLSNLQSSNHLFDEEYSRMNYIKGTSCTPLTWHKQRIRYHLLEYDDLIDSSELNSRHYKKIACTIEDNYEKYDSFIIIYGTDTMSYMASQLSFMLENLAKTVVITGAQIPISEWRNDAESNLIGALTVAEHCIPEVTVLFNGSLFRGNRIIKSDSTKMQPFSSPNFGKLATFGVFLNYKKNLIRKPPAPGLTFKVFHMSDRRISLIYMHPLMTKDIFLSSFKKSKAIILQLYGMGNFPMERTDLVEIIKDAVLKHKKTVIITSQCRAGMVKGSYSSCLELTRIGVLLSEDMTTETVIAKLSYALGKGFRDKELEEVMRSDLRGEISAPVEKIQDENQLTLSNILTMSNILQDSTLEDLNKMAEMLQSSLTQAKTNEYTVEKLQKSLKDGVDINSKNDSGEAPIHIAAKTNNEDLVDFLINQENLDVNSLDIKENSPLYYSCVNGSSSIATKLISKGGSCLSSPGCLARTLESKAKINDIQSLKLFHSAGVNLDAISCKVKILKEASKDNNNQDEMNTTTSKINPAIVAAFAGFKEGFMLDEKSSSPVGLNNSI
ncbi:unnamed protein product [Moneuplotes crassus]|uniref:asparaginase n=1 Tax=Euplotes crassus TaxID=5936 RepID=A0AAD1Y864_EUPCR|nr:unnamed protein product [Moneuplotes crassus]